MVKDDGSNTSGTLTRRDVLKQLGMAGASLAVGSLGLSVPAAARTHGGKRANLLRMSYSTEPNILDPALGTFPSWQHERVLYGTLVRYGHRRGYYFDLEPDLATSWNISADGLVYTFNLRDHVQFHRNFGQLTSDDVKFSLERVMDPATKSPYASSLSNVKAVQAPDPLTVRIILARPESGFIYYLVEKLGWIVSKQAVLKYGQAFGTTPETTIGSGPYLLSQWTRLSVIGFERNSHYYIAHYPRIATATARYSPDISATALAFQAGDFDIIPVTSDTYSSLAATGKYQPFRSETTPPGYYLLNTTRKPLDDIRVRQAMAYAIDHKKVVEATDNLFTEIHGTIVPPTTWGYDGSTPRHDYDPALARKLLAEAGYPHGTPEIECPKHTTPFYPWDDIVNGMWNAVGIRTKRPLLSDGAIGAKLFSGDGWIISDINARPPHCDPFFWDKFYSKNITHPFYTGIDDLLLQGRTAVNRHVQYHAYSEAQRKLCYEDVAVVGGVYYHWLYMAQPYVKNLHDDPGRRVPWDTFWIEGA